VPQRASIGTIVETALNWERKSNAAQRGRIANDGRQKNAPDVARGRGGGRLI
jgi:hypothetical protein